MNHVLAGVACLVSLLFGLSFVPVPARAQEVGQGDELVLAALGGVQPLPSAEMARQTARGFANGSDAGAHVSVTVPTVGLWDDFGAFSPSSIGNSIVTITTGNGP